MIMPQDNEKTIQESWEEDFAALFGKDKFHPFTIDVPTAKAFINQAISLAIIKERERVSKEVEGMKKETYTENHNKLYDSNEVGYNQALKEVLSIINEQ